MFYIHPVHLACMILVVYLYFDCDPSHEVRCGIFHLWHHVGTQEFGFWIILDFRFKIRDVQPVFSFCLEVDSTNSACVLTAFFIILGSKRYVT